jgi:DNA-binding NtrC family response regulator
MSAVYADVDLPGVHFVPKPFDADRLLDVVAGAIEDQGTANGRGVKPGRSNGTADDP